MQSNLSLTIKKETVWGEIVYMRNSFLMMKEFKLVSEMKMKKRRKTMMIQVITVKIN
jgi:hypothetical protein